MDSISKRFRYLYKAFLIFYKLSIPLTKYLISSPQTFSTHIPRLFRDSTSEHWKNQLEFKGENPDTVKRL
ncbi:MAG: hypothetical protein Ct9H300mP28_36680 [Pseudomonadota bacterium]|nr:MAG: hypothetical protein Ct9H300mP28_36680 [Pseudomonadota bacterium]